jgi:glycine/D-amino acid oxidase-like deaminating enzyme
VHVGGRGFWLEQDGAPPARPALAGPLDVDVAIVGAGYTGLWTAYYLKRADPSLRVVVLEAERVGQGASGRNGGWVSGFLSGPRERYAAGHGRDAVVALQRAMFATVDEVGRVLATEGVDAEYVKGGNLGVALGPAQAARATAWIERERTWGLGEDDLKLLSPDQLGERLRVAGASGATFTPHVARVHPAKLVRGLAALVEAAGVSVYEHTRVQEIRPGAAITEHGPVAARWVVRATEGYTSDLHGLERALIPMNSTMIVTEPLPSQTWDELGWAEREVVNDGAHVYAYLQRSADGRIAIGGRGRPYRYGSSTAHTGEVRARTVAALRAKLGALFPVVADAPVAHAWSGVLGVPRDWCPSVAADPGSGLAHAGGYVGQGVAASNLAARTLRDLLLERPSELTSLPWVGRRQRRWEPEPLRYLGVNGVYGAYALADRIEARTGRPSRLGALVDRLSGRH